MSIALIQEITMDGVRYSWLAEQQNTQYAFVNWDEVEKVVVFKRDLFSYDLICLSLRTSEPNWIEFDEEDANWKQLVETIAHALPGCDTWSEWFGKVAFPAFETNELVIFRRNGNDRT